jgi:hypothetical protein
VRRLPRSRSTEVRELSSGVKVGSRRDVIGRSGVEETERRVCDDGSQLPSIPDVV